LDPEKIASEQEKIAPDRKLFSAVTCHRFGRLRPVAAFGGFEYLRKRQQAAAGQSADRSAHSKSPRDARILACG